FFSSRRRHTRFSRDWSSDVCSSDLMTAVAEGIGIVAATPHVNRDYPPDPKAMGYAVGALNVALARMEVALAVLPGGELAMATAQIGRASCRERVQSVGAR